MNAVTTHAAPPAPAPSPGFWQRRVVQPVRQQLTQGVTPDRIAATIGVGTVCSLLPFLGFTTLLNLGVGLALRMNQPILHALNTVLGPLQLVLILVYVRGGEWIWGHSGAAFTLGEMMREFRERSLLQFIQQFGWAGIHAFTAWILTAPIVAGVLYVSFRPLLRRAAARLRR